MTETTSAPTMPPYLNNAMKFILRSPIHGVVSKQIMLITFTGRKSGKSYTTPVSYSQHGDQVHVFSHANWWKNLSGGAPVTMRIRGQEVQGIAEPVAEDKQAIAQALGEHLRKVPSDAKYYDVTFDEEGNPRAEEVAQAVQTVVMIRIAGC
jgi:deazaflavin-dependent oxidoreductase (nitroreductase family)